MERQSSNDTIIDMCSAILYNEYNAELENQFLSVVSEIRNLTFDDYTLNWILNTLNFLAVNNNQDRVKFIKIETAKLTLLKAFAEYNEYLSGLDLTDKESENEIYFEKDGMFIYKRYVPSRFVKFTLPPEGELFKLTVMNITKSGEQFKAVVEIDNQGYVQNIIKEPVIVNSNKKTPEEIEDLYTDLMSDILKYDEE